MTVTVNWVNDRGLEEIRAFLAAKYKGAQQLTREKLLFWVKAAENKLFEGKEACIELKPSESVTGRREVYRISPLGLDRTAFDDGL